MKRQRGIWVKADHVYTLTILFIPLTAIGCAFASLAYRQSVNESAEIILPEYVRYVEADASLSEEERAASIDLAREMLELSREALR